MSALALLDERSFTSRASNTGAAGEGLFDGFQDFTPFTLDVSPLQKFLIQLSQQVQALKQENVELRNELAELKVSKRLEALEQGIQELADMVRPTSSYGTFNPEGQAQQQQQPPSSAPHQPQAQQEQEPSQQARIRGGGQAADANWVLFEFTALKERMAQMERKAEALWHIQEGDEEMRAGMERLKHDVEQVHGIMTDTQQSARMAQHLAEQLQAANHAASEFLRETADKVHTLQLLQDKGSEERKETSSKFENTINQIWDQIRHVESSLSQRLTLAETSQVSALQEVDEMKEAANEVVERVDDLKRHIAALENKLESFNTQVAAAISPLHNSLGNLSARVDELAVNKQDTSSAITVQDVNVAVSRAIDHADRRSDNILKAVAGIEERVESLNDTKANKVDVVMTVDLEALLTQHASELDHHLDQLKEDIMKAMSVKADKEELAALDSKVGGRVGSLESAILKGLKAISDKVSAALAEKLDLTKFNEFKIQVRAILADVEDRLRDWSPAALGMKAPMDRGGNVGATSCLCCDSRVRSVRDLKGMGFANEDKVFSPERLPNVQPLLPSINSRNPESGAAYNNAKLALHKQHAQNVLSKSTASIMEVLPAAPTAAPSSPNAQAPHSLHNLDPGSMLTLPPAKEGQGVSQGGSKSGRKQPQKVEVETIAGQIMQGKIPNTRGKVPPVNNSNNALKSRQASAAPGPWDTVAPPDAPTDLVVEPATRSEAGTASPGQH